ncbi:MAG: triose-phosphate isomerase [Acidobacteria bacterium]|nr:triose-phosphate isomerase [Acidobacteriota bacterium]
MKREKLLAANWKLNLPAEGIAAYCAAMRGRGAADPELVVSPPAPFVDALVNESKGAGTGFGVASQNTSQHDQGAFTGEVSARMIAGLGARYAILGHSERRTLFGESDEMIGQKLAKAFDAGLVPIFCIGESQETRDAGKTLAWLDAQVKTAMTTAARSFSRLVVAYEPIWAIGTGRNAKNPEIQEAHQAIAGMLEGLVPDDCTLSILYGGSVKADNAAEIASLSEVDGFLVGGASLVSASFLSIWGAMRR